MKGSARGLTFGGWITVAIAIVIAITLWFAGPLGAQEAAPAAELRDVQQRVVGSATIEDGLVKVSLAGMLPVAGDHRIAMTSGSTCDLPDFASAGNEVHLLPPIQFFVDGSANYTAPAPADLSGVGSIVIYADASDPPTDRILCGVFPPLTGSVDGGAEPGSDPCVGGLGDIPSGCDAGQGLGDIPSGIEGTTDGTGGTDGTDDARGGGGDTSGGLTEESAGAAIEAEVTEAAEADDRLSFEEFINMSGWAFVYDVQGRLVGYALLTPATRKVTLVEVYIEDLLQIPGDRKLAIASTGNCVAPFYELAGDDIHVLPDLQLFASGTADYSAAVDRLDLESLYDADGSSIVIYEDRAPLEGDRIACGAISRYSLVLEAAGVDVSAVSIE